MKRARQAQPVAGTSRSESVVQPNFSFVSTEQCDTADSSEPPLKRVTKEVRLVPRRRHSESGKQHKKERRAKLKAKTPTVVLSQADTPTTVLPPKRARSSSGSAEQPATPDAISQAVALIIADAQDSAKDADKMALGKHQKTKFRRK